MPRENKNINQYEKELSPGNIGKALDNIKTALKQTNKSWSLDKDSEFSNPYNKNDFLQQIGFAKTDPLLSESVIENLKEIGILVIGTQTKTLLEHAERSKVTYQVNIRRAKEILKID